jgi:hypothetical protein
MVNVGSNSVFGRKTGAGDYDYRSIDGMRISTRVYLNLDAQVNTWIEVKGEAALALWTRRGKIHVRGITN